MINSMHQSAYTVQNSIKGDHCMELFLEMLFCCKGDSISTRRKLQAAMVIALGPCSFCGLQFGFPSDW